MPKNKIKIEDVPPEMIRAAASAFGRMGGLTKSPARTAACRRNGLCPCAPGKSRGRPRKDRSDPKPVNDTIGRDGLVL